MLKAASLTCCKIKQGEQGGLGRKTRSEWKTLESCYVTFQGDQASWSLKTAGRADALTRKEHCQNADHQNARHLRMSDLAIKQF